MESALYGWYLAGNQGAAQRWHDKPTDRARLKAWNKEFKFSALRLELSKTSEGTAEWAKYLHQQSIDFGSHPNKEALYSNMAHERCADGGSVLQMIFLHAWRAFSVSTAKFVIETGMFAVELFGMSFPDAECTFGLLAAAAGHAEALSALVSETTQFVEDDIKRSDEGRYEQGTAVE